MDIKDLLKLISRISFTGPGGLEKVTKVLKEFAEKLNTVVTEDEIENILSSYYTQEEVQSILEGYVSNTQIQAYYTKEQVDLIVSALGKNSYKVAWDGSTQPVVTNIPAGVTVTYNSIDYTGTLSASADTTNNIYLVGQDMYVTSKDGDIYSWVFAGTTELDLNDYATEAEVSQLRQEVTDLEEDVDTWNGAIVVSFLNLIESWDLSGTTGYTNYIPVKPNTVYSFYLGATPALKKPIAFYEYDENKTQLLKTTSVNSITTRPDTVYIRINEYKTVTDNTMVIEGNTVPTRYVSHEDSKTIVTENADFNDGIGKIVEEQVLPDYMVNGTNVIKKTLPISANDWLAILRYNVVDNSTNTQDKGINQNTGEPYDTSNSDITDYIAVLPGDRYVILSGVSGVFYYDENKIYKNAYADANKNCFTIPQGVYYIRCNLIKSKDGIISQKDVDVHDSGSFAKFQQYEDEFKAYSTELLSESGSKVLVGEQYNLISALREASLTDGKFLYTSGTSKYISNAIKGIAGDYNFYVSSAYDESILAYTLLTYDASDNLLASTAYSGVRGFTIGDGVSYFRVWINRNSACLVMGDAEDASVNRDADTLKVAFRNDDYREQILADILRSPDAKKILYGTLYPHLYGKKWAALGDSLTNGTGATPYVTVVGEMFAMDAINYGIIGSQIAQYSEGQTANDPMCVRYADMDSEADIVTIMGGANDSYEMLGTMDDRQENGQYTFYSGCHRLLSGLCQKYAGKKIGVITSPQFCRNKSTDDQWGAPDINMNKNRAKAAALKQVAEFYGLPCFDLFNCEGFSGYSDDERALFWQGDKLHLTTFGQAFIADKIAKWLMTI